MGIRAENIVGQRCPEHPRTGGRLVIDYTPEGSCKSWRTHFCVPRSHSCERFLCWPDCQHAGGDKHFKGLTFNRDGSMWQLRSCKILDLDVGTSADAARKSACATMSCHAHRKLSDIAQEC